MREGIVACRPSSILTFSHFLDINCVGDLSMLYRPRSLQFHLISFSHSPVPYLLFLPNPAFQPVRWTRFQNHPTHSSIHPSIHLTSSAQMAYQIQSMDADDLGQNLACGIFVDALLRLLLHLLQPAQVEIEGNSKTVQRGWMFQLLD